jgi:hypothetical protein
MAATVAACEEGLRRANLTADYVRTSPVVPEAFTKPPGYNSLLPVASGESVRRYEMKICSYMAVYCRARGAVPACTDHFTLKQSLPVPILTTLALGRTLVARQRMALYQITHDGTCRFATRI